MTGTFSFMGNSAWMQHSRLCLVLADIILLIHFALVLFIIGGLILILVGNFSGWIWVNRLLFRIVHLAAIAVVAAESWLGITCPLTALEDILRISAGSQAYGTGFIRYWIHRVMFYEAPPWIFTLLYTAFVLVVAAAWMLFPPKHHKRENK